MSQEYRWNNPQEWLLWKAQEYAANNNTVELLQLINVLAPQLDADNVQDTFQSEMDADGYFEKIA